MADNLINENSPRPLALHDDPTASPNRTCGTCFACCVWSGVEALATEDRIALRTYAGQSCVHLDPSDPRRCCSVYANRPKACERFQCAWLQGLGGELDRPDQSGIMVSIYADDTIDPNLPANATVTIIDGAKCGEIDDSSRPLRKYIDSLMAFLSLRDIRIVNYKTRTVLHLTDGFIYMGRLHKSDSPENLSFDHSHNNSLPIGRFEIRGLEKEPLQ